MTLKLAIPLFCIVAIGAFGIGVLVNDIPGLTISREVQLGAVIGSLITGTIALLLAFAIPYLITKHFDDSKGIKQFLIGEVNSFASEVEKVRNKLDACYNAQGITNGDKMEIRFLFDYLDKKVDSLSEQLEFSYPNQCKNDITELRNANNAFWRSITGGELMDQNFGAITLEFRKAAFTAYCTFEAKIKMLAHKIGKY